MRPRRWISAIVLVAAAAVLVACAGPEAVRGRLHVGMDDAPEGKTIFWPAEPEVPRFAYAGTLTGEPNFRRDDAAVSGLRAFGRWLAGLDHADAPVVLQRPSGIIGDNGGRLYVSDSSRQAVFMFDEAAGELQVWDQATQRLKFVAPSGLAVDSQRLFVADAELGLVAVLDRAGQPAAPLGRGLLQRPTGVAFDTSSGTLFVADTYAHDIKAFAADGRLLRTMGRRGSGAGEFNFPTHLAWADGTLYVTDTMNSRVQALDMLGLPRGAALGMRGLLLGNLVRPKGVAVDGEGNVYVVESYFDTLLVYSPRGEFLLNIGGTGTATGRFYLPAGVWVDARNRVHVADMFNGRIVLFQFLGGG